MTRRLAVVKVQMARRDMGIPEDAYRMMLERLTGKTSSTACTDAELAEVLKEMRAKGWKPKVVARGAPARPKARAADHPSAKKARALWLSLWQLGEVRSSEEEALEAFAQRQLQVARLQWADQGLTYKLIEALKAMAERAGWSQNLSGLPKTADPIKVLKARLIRAQTSKLGQMRQIADYERWDHSELDALIRSQGAEIRAAGMIGDA